MKTPVQQGDIYKLGEHMLGCGSASDSKFIDKLIDNKIVKCILTDPPYGVGYVEGKQGFNQMKPETNKVIVGDQLQTEEQYVAFTSGWLDAVKEHLDHYNACYIFNSDLMFRALRTGMEASKFYYSQMIIWIKNTVVLGRKDYLPMHELIAYGWYGQHKMQRSKAKSVLFCNKPARSKLHPTMKPIALLRKILPNSTGMGEWVYDPFGGSGSTLIACEQLKRRCIMVEIDPQYVSTIIERWEKLTELKAEKYEQKNSNDKAGSSEGTQGSGQNTGAPNQVRPGKRSKRAEQGVEAI
jgi:DNA modification methylase